MGLSDVPLGAGELRQIAGLIEDLTQFLLNDEGEYRGPFGGEQSLIGVVELPVHRPVDGYIGTQPIIGHAVLEDGWIGFRPA